MKISCHLIKNYQNSGQYRICQRAPRLSTVLWPDCLGLGNKGTKGSSGARIAGNFPRFNIIRPTPSAYLPLSPSTLPGPNVFKTSHCTNHSIRMIRLWKDTHDDVFMWVLFRISIKDYLCHFSTLEDLQIFHCFIWTFNNFEG